MADRMIEANGVELCTACVTAVHKLPAPAQRQHRHVTLDPHAERAGIAVPSHGRLVRVGIGRLTAVR